MARVVQSLDEAKALQPGEILVTVTTMPAWTPLFGTAAAVVTETGGALSHCAIVAREYGIPAVVGAFGATRTITTGQTISRRRRERPGHDRNRVTNTSFQPNGPSTSQEGPFSLPSWWDNRDIHLCNGALGLN